MSTFEETRPKFEKSSKVETGSWACFEGIYPLQALAWWPSMLEAASAGRGNNLHGFKVFDLKAKARI